MNETTRWEQCKTWLFHCFPHHWVSRLVFFLARLETRLKDPLVRLFIRRFDVDMSEAEQPDPEAYASFDAFFTRRLQPQAREFCDNPRTLAAPCDGRLLQAGDFDAGQLAQAKGRVYGTADLLGGAAAADFNSGKFCTIYLSPADCHRVYMPMDGTLETMIHIPGRLFSVAPYAARTVPRLYARNERVVCIFNTGFGKIAIVLVGAVNVAAIETRWHGLVAPRSQAAAFFHYGGPGGEITLARGDEMGCFHLGSSVILLAENRNWAWNPLYPVETALKMGCELACLRDDADAVAI